MTNITPILRVEGKSIQRAAAVTRAQVKVIIGLLSYKILIFSFLKVGQKIPMKRGGLYHSSVMAIPISLAPFSVAVSGGSIGAAVSAFLSSRNFKLAAM